MFLHLFYVKSPIFNSELVKMIIKFFDRTEHRFIFAYKESYEIVKEYPECSCDPNILNVKTSMTYIREYDHIFLHSMPFNVKSLKIPNALLHKCTWCSWGHDLYPAENRLSPGKQLYAKIKDQCKKIKLRHLYGFAAGFNGDFDYYKAHYGEKQILYHATYPMGYHIEQFPEAVPMHKPLRIMIGHSGFPYLQHEKYLNLLEPFQQDIQLYLILNYGYKDYIEKIKSIAQKKFNNLVVYDDFMEQSDYVNVLNKVDVGIFDFEKQGAFGNILLLFYLKKCVYLSETGAMYRYMRKENVYVRSVNRLVEDLSDISHITYPPEKLQQNRLWAEAYLSEPMVVSQWKAMFDDMKGEKKY